MRTKAAAAADADLLIEGVILATEGECPSCEASAPISQNERGETIVDCASPNCNSRGVAGEKCEGCDEIILQDTLVKTAASIAQSRFHSRQGGMVMFSKFRHDFPTLEGENPPVYLDNACMTHVLNQLLKRLGRTTRNLQGVEAVQFTDMLPLFLVK